MTTWYVWREKPGRGSVSRVLRDHRKRQLKKAFSQLLRNEKSWKNQGIYRDICQPSQKTAGIPLSLKKKKRIIKQSIIKVVDNDVNIVVPSCCLIHDDDEGDDDDDNDDDDCNDDDDDCDDNDDDGES